MSGLIFELNSIEWAWADKVDNNLFEHYLCLQLSELEQRVIEAEERAEEAEDKVRILPDIVNDSFVNEYEIRFSARDIQIGSGDGTEVNRMAIKSKQ